MIEKKIKFKFFITIRLLDNNLKSIHFKNLN
jgi:hypothetical protein